MTRKFVSTDFAINRKLGSIRKKARVRLWTLSDQELEVVRQVTKNSYKRVENEEFDGTESKRDIDSNLWNKIRPAQETCQNNLNASVNSRSSQH